MLPPLIMWYFNFALGKSLFHDNWFVHADIWTGQIRHFSSGDSCLTLKYLIPVGGTEVNWTLHSTFCSFWPEMTLQIARALLWLLPVKHTHFFFLKLSVSLPHNSSRGISKHVHLEFNSGSCFSTTAQCSLLAREQHTFVLPRQLQKESRFFICWNNS